MLFPVLEQEKCFFPVLEREKCLFSRSRTGKMLVFPFQNGKNAFFPVLEREKCFFQEKLFVKEKIGKIRKNTLFRVLFQFCTARTIFSSLQLHFSQVFSVQTGFSKPLPLLGLRPRSGTMFLESILNLENLGKMQFQTIKNFSCSELEQYPKQNTIFQRELQLDTWKIFFLNSFGIIRNSQSLR